ncbi:MAG: methyltransferase domain-containing protein [Pseudomonadota bacterium]|nr:MAG: methyltransferase domain-containing protein [Pseudomonadota bacterium]
MNASRSGLLLLLSLSLLFSAGACAQEQSVRPGVNAYYQDPEFSTWVRRFESAGREVYDLREAIVHASGVGPGMSVADVGAGTGLFTLLFASRVGNAGRVYAVDISETFVREVEARARTQGAGNVAGVVSEPRDAGLPSSALDLVFVCDTYHHFEYPQDMLRSIHDALRPDGTLVVIDYRKVAGTSSQWVMGHVRAGKDTVIREIQAEGFRLIEDNPMLRDNFLLRFRKEPR